MLEMHTILTSMPGMRMECKCNLPLSPIKWDAAGCVKNNMPVQGSPICSYLNRVTAGACAHSISPAGLVPSPGQEYSISLA